MIDIDSIRQHTMELPERFSVFGNIDHFLQLPENDRERIRFLDKQAQDYIYDFFNSANLVTSGGWAPFEKGNFKDVQEFNEFYGTEESVQNMKKWLYSRGLAFQSEVFVLSNSKDQAMFTNWKMVLRYAQDIFGFDDTAVFDHTMEWCLFYYHEDQMFFGKGRFYDPAEEEEKMKALNERKARYPQFRHPYL